MFLYNSLTKKIEVLPNIDPLRLFVCGPTVYDDAHIGHARTYLFFDMLAKYLRSRSRKVQYIQNITDVDDKIINRAREEGKKPLELAQEFTTRYREDMEVLGITAVDTYAPASAFIPQIVDQVLRLKEQGCAYEITGEGWYFNISKFKDYGKLSGRTVTQAEDATSRVDQASKKQNKGDFALWKHVSVSNPEDKSFALISGEPAWHTKLGWGRPGWHIEDTAISEHYFGEQYDLHGGAIDLMFPHHEAEIALAEATSGKVPFVKHWLHTGFLTVNGEKMSKSKGNFITIRNLLKNHSANAFRLLVLQHHWRSPLDYSDEAISQAKQALDRLSKTIGRLQHLIAAQNPKNEPTSSTIDNSIKKLEEEFMSALENDFHTPRALSYLFLVENVAEQGDAFWLLPEESAKRMLSFLKDSLAMFGIALPSPAIPNEAQQLANDRKELRSNQQFVQADELRDKINALGYVIEDTPLGPFLWPKNN